jgi:hypothetical protein
MSGGLRNVALAAALAAACGREKPPPAAPTPAPTTALTVSSEAGDRLTARPAPAFVPDDGTAAATVVT